MALLTLLDEPTNHLDIGRIEALLMEKLERWEALEGKAAAASS